MTRARALALRAFACASVTTFASAPASAADPPLRSEDRAAVSIASNATNAPHARAVDSVQIAPELSGAVRVAPAIVVVSRGAVAFTASRFGDSERGYVTRVSNVLIGGRWIAVEDGGALLTLGLSAGAPLVTVPEGGITKSAAAEQADRVALGASGPRGIWSWARNAVPLVMSARAARVFGPIRLSVDLEPGLLVSVNRDASRAALVTSVEAALVSPVVSPFVGLSMLASTRPLDRDDFAQTGLTLGVRHDLGTFFVWSEARLQLDGPQGVGQPNATFFGATLGGGARF